jgi:dTDP-4-amino-4,6-dideoxygalactose transaminase
MPIGGQTDFCTRLKHEYAMPWCGVTGSGTSAIYACLLALKKQTNRRQVVLPAYTAPSLILPIRKAGLIPVLCDISPETLNAGPEEMLPVVNQNTLAVMPVHMFGLPTDVLSLKTHLQASQIAVIEDAASAMGATLQGKPVGTCGDIGIISFNRGKNLSTFTGGAIFTHREDWVPDIETAIQSFDKPSLKYAARIRTFACALSLIVRPWAYTLLQPLAERFKYTSLHTDFHTYTYTDFQARLGQQLFKKLNTFTQKRASNAQFLQENLKDVSGIGLPRLLEASTPAYNQFPILLPDENRRATLHQKILETGIEATLLYPDPIHRLYADIWNKQGADPFPAATAISRRLLLLPIHPLVPQKALDQIIDIIHQVQK